MNDAIIQHPPGKAETTLQNINQQFDQINQQFSELNLQYNNSNNATAVDSAKYQQYGQPQPSNDHANENTFESYSTNNVNLYDPQSQPQSLNINQGDHYGHENDTMHDGQYNHQQQQQHQDQHSYDYWNQQQQGSAQEVL